MPAAARRQRRLRRNGSIHPSINLINKANINLDQLSPSHSLLRLNNPGLGQAFFSSLTRRRCTSAGASAGAHNPITQTSSWREPPQAITPIILLYQGNAQTSAGATFEGPGVNMVSGCLHLPFLQFYLLSTRIASNNESSHPMEISIQISMQVSMQFLLQFVKDFFTDGGWLRIRILIPQ